MQCVFAKRKARVSFNFIYYFYLVVIIILLNGLSFKFTADIVSNKGKIS